jgi:mannan endo-1,4-beta-mannosidase
MSKRIALAAALVASLACGGQGPSGGGLVGPQPSMSLTAVPAPDGVVPVNTNASQGARRVLSYLAQLKNRSDNRVVSGQFIASTGTGPAAWAMFYDEIHRQTGKDVGLIGIDLEGNGWCLPTRPESWCHPPGGIGVNIDPFWIDKAIRHSDRGGLVTLHWSAHNPWTDGTVEDMQGTGGTALDQLITPGSPVYAKWMSTLDQVAVGLQQLRDANVVVLWRPFHEMNGNFWWGRQNSSLSFVRLWQHMFGYFTNAKGLNNLLWVYAPVEWPGVPVLAQYPGDAYVDIVGFDHYPDTQTFAVTPSYEALAAKGKVMAMTEYGYRGLGLGDDVNVINSIQSNMPLLTYVMFWNDFSDRSYSMTSNLNATGFMGHPWTVDISEVGTH